jgi:hypothetical protein
MPPAVKAHISPSFMLLSVYDFFAGRVGCFCRCNIQFFGLGEVVLGVDRENVHTWQIGLFLKVILARFAVNVSL